VGGRVENALAFITHQVSRGLAKKPLKSQQPISNFFLSEWAKAKVCSKWGYMSPYVDLNAHKRPHPRESE
jgi:hypothetical protein